MTILTETANRMLSVYIGVLPDSTIYSKSKERMGVRRKYSFGQQKNSWRQAPRVELLIDFFVELVDAVHPLLDDWRDDQQEYSCSNGQPTNKSEYGRVLCQCIDSGQVVGCCFLGDEFAKQVSQ